MNYHSNFISSVSYIILDSKNKWITLAILNSPIFSRKSTNG
jgi:hypothetical protein